MLLQFVEFPYRRSITVETHIVVQAQKNRVSAGFGQFRVKEKRGVEQALPFGLFAQHLVLFDDRRLYPIDDAPVATLQYEHGSDGKNHA